MAQKQIILNTPGTGSWPDPGDWNAGNNTIECLGPGANGCSIYPNSPNDGTFDGVSGGNGGGG